jgi:hypothetical protein
MQEALWGPPQPPRRRGRPTRRARFDRSLGILATYADAHGCAPDEAAQLRSSGQTLSPQMYTLMGDEDWRAAFGLESVGLAASGLYWNALSWAKERTRGQDIASAESVMGDLESWFIPAAMIRGWKATREAKKLVAAGIWIDVQGGYRYLHLRDENRPKVVAEKRTKNTRKVGAKRAKQRHGVPADDATGGW